MITQQQALEALESVHGAIFRAYGSPAYRLLRQYIEQGAQPGADEATKGGDLETNVRYLLDNCPHTVRDFSGDRTGSRAKEDLAGSLAITFLGMQHRLPATKKPQQEQSK